MVWGWTELGPAPSALDSSPCLPSSKGREDSDDMPHGAFVEHQQMGLGEVLDHVEPGLEVNRSGPCHDSTRLQSADGTC